MSNYKELRNGKIAFHPGYYIEEYIDNIGLTQADFAKRIGTTPKNMSLLIRGEQSLSVDIAFKLSRVIGTSVQYWLNLQNEYDTLSLEDNSLIELEKEKEVLKELDYKYFVVNFHLPDLPRQKDKQVEEVRKFLQISSLTVLKNKDMSVRFRKSQNEQGTNIIGANAMVQIATNISLSRNDMAPFDKKKFVEAIDYALTLTRKHNTFGELLKERFSDAGVDLIFLPYLPKSRINGATKRINKHIMLMLSDRNHSSDSFWFTLFHEIGHIMNGDFGISFEKESGKEEDLANSFAENSLIPFDKYQEFVKKK